MPKFLLKFHAAVIKEIPADKTPITIGRKSDNDVVIDNMAVSGHHARVVMQGANYVIEDLQSTNGIFLNEKKILNAALKNNDQILIGQHTLLFVNPQAQAKSVDSEATVVITPQRQQEILKQETAKTQPQPPAAPPAPAAPAPQPAAPAPQPAAPAPQPADSTPQPEASAPASAASEAKSDQTALLRVIEGKGDQNEYSLTGLLTYIGKSETAAIKIKGMFAPDIAALISKRPNGYLITAVKDGYPKLNGKSLSGQTDLKDGDLVEVAGIKFLFQFKQ